MRANGARVGNERRICIRAQVPQIKISNYAAIPPANRPPLEHPRRPRRSIEKFIIGKRRSTPRKFPARGLPPAPVSRVNYVAY